AAACGGLFRRGGGRRRIIEQRNLLHGTRAVRDESRAQRLAPALLEPGLAEALLPRGAHDIMAREAELAGEQAEQLDRRPAAVERRDERLLDGERAVEGPGIAPGLELVGGRYMPRAARGGLVDQQS